MDCVPRWLSNRLGKWWLDRMAKTLNGNNKAELEPKYYDCRTIEYTTEWKDNTLFEMCRGLDKSFAYNRYSRPDDLLQLLT